MSCHHPPPAESKWIFCRKCGYFENGVRLGDATNDRLKSVLKKAYAEGQPCGLTYDGELHIVEPIGDA